MLHRYVMGLIGAVLAVSCGTGAQNKETSTLKSDLYVCVANNGFESKTYTKFGSSYEDGYESAVKECREKSGNVCTAVCKDNTIDTLLDAPEENKVWACVVKDLDTGKSWARTGATYPKARQSAEDYCVKTKAGTRCQVQTCTPAA